MTIKTLSKIEVTKRKGRSGKYRLTYYLNKHPELRKYYLNNPIIREIINRVHKENKDFAVAIVGKKGTGKSISSLIWGMLLMGKSFSLDRIVYTLDEFKNLVKKSKRGQVIILDEAGAKEGASSMYWFTSENKEVASLIQTCREKHLILIFNSPNFAFITAQIRKMFDAYIEMLSAREDKGYSTGVFKFSFTKGKAKRDEDTIDYYLRFVAEGIRYVLIEIKFPLPPIELVNMYRKKRNKYVESLIDKSLIKKEEDRKPREKIELRKVVRWFVRNLNNKKISIKRVMTKDRFSPQKLRTMYYKIKGIDIGQNMSNQLAISLNWEAEEGKIPILFEYDLQKT